MEGKKRRKEKNTPPKLSTVSKCVIPQHGGSLHRASSIQLSLGPQDGHGLFQ